jgi:hypothetical protein
VIGAVLRDLFGPGTWGAGGNIAAAPILAATAAVLTWLAHKLGILAKLTDHIGRRGAAWWDKHHGEHAVRRHRQALEEHEESKRAAERPEGEP